MMFHVELTDIVRLVLLPFIAAFVIAYAMGLLRRKP